MNPKNKMANYRVHQIMRIYKYIIIYITIHSNIFLPGAICSKHGIARSILSAMPDSGDGFFPQADPWGKKFSQEYCKDRWRVAGQRIAGPFHGCLEGIQGDQDYIRTMMSPSRFQAVLRV